jgi:cytochrome P450
VVRQDEPESLPGAMANDYRSRIVVLCQQTLGRGLTEVDLMMLCPVAHGANVDLTDTGIFVGGHAHHAWRRLRAHQPVAWNPGTAWFPGFWSITKYEDVRRISRDPTTFVSGHGYLMVTDPRKPGPAAGVGKTLLGIDPPRHARMRRLVSKGFTPRMAARWEPRVRAITDEILDQPGPRGECDFVTDIAGRLPLAVICTILGVPREDWGHLNALSNQVLGAADPEYRLTARFPATTSERGVSGFLGRCAQNATAGLGLQRLLGYFSRLAARRRSEPRDDLVSNLIAAEIEGERLSDEEIQYFCYLLILAGNETTRSAIAGGMLAFLEYHEEWERLQAQPELLPTAVEEILRWTSPVMHMARVAARDVEVRGQQIKAGEKVVLWYPSANRDEEVFANPDHFDIGRRPNDHVAFGYGEHFCLGAGLARLQLRVFFELLAIRLPDITLAGEAERLRSTFIAGIKHLPVRFEARGELRQNHACGREFRGA